MNRFIKNKTLWLSVAFALWIGSTFSVFGQVYSKPTNPPKPLLQNIEVQTNNPTPSSTPLVTKTGSSAPSTRKTSFPVLADVEIPGYSGILVEDINGNIVLDNYSNYAFNPASNVKIATAYAVLKTFGPDYRFPTNVWTDGQIDKTTGTLYGNLYVSGRDLSFGLEQGITIAHELNRLGIQNVNGDLVVTGDFVMSQSSTVERAGSLLSATMNSAKRNASANRAWQSFQVNSKRTDLVGIVPSVAVSGGTYVQTIPTNARLLFSHESAPMREIVKATLCFSNNYLSEKLGDMLGGAYAVARIVQQNAQIAPEEFYLQTSSGLGTNRVTPQAMMRLLRTLRKELARNKMTFADIMPVAGIDRGTLEHRFDTDFSRGSIVGKTGTLGNTDGGVSTLAGEIQTRQGKLLFVIFNQRGGVNRFRSFQNMLVSLIQGQFGGATPLIYTEIPLDVRLAKTRITYPTTRATTNQ
jgi:D-alanyl-D-alanine carboxypeptidase/D-alanyl-D-alanine-endopeptidase (penicillin-binding protein 4)